MKIGVDYCPEQLDKSMWEKDAEAMARTGVRLIRIGSGVWSRIEPQEGEYNIEWLDEAISVFSKYAIGIIMCTPTSYPPKWLYQKHPEIIITDIDGHSAGSGKKGRRCINSPVFREYAKKITEALIRHFSGNSAIAAWQIDSELEAYPCKCDVCRNKFREWLVERYDNVEGINKAHKNNVYSREYSDISQIDIPDDNSDPALCLDYYRFTTECTADFVREAMLTIRLEDTKVPITTNADMGENSPDLYKLYELLDFVSYENYVPLKIPKNSDKIYSHAFELDLMRGIKDGSFWVMEQPEKSKYSVSPSMKSGMITGYAMQAMIRGADTVINFRWRTAVSGADMFRHGILDHGNVPNRRFLEFSELCRKVSQLDTLNNTRIVSDIAIIYSPESESALNIQPQTEDFDYMEQLKAFHSAFMSFGANVDVVPSSAELSRYKIVVAPSMFVYSKKTAENIYRYVINGGTVVMTVRSGVKDAHNNCIPDTLPTAYKELIGAEITEYDAIGSDEQIIKDFSGKEFSCTQWCDILQPTTARAYAEYVSGEYRCMPAVTMNHYCGGVAYYVGTVCGADFYESFASNLMMQTGVSKLKGLPKGIEVVTRTNGRDEYICFFNNSEKAVTIPLPKMMYSLISSTGKDRLELRPFDTDIVRK